MFQRAFAVTALMIGFMGAPGGAFAQLLPPLPPLGTAPPPMGTLPPPGADSDDDLPPYDPPPGYRRPAPVPNSAYGPPPRTYESEALPPPGQYSPPPQGQYATPGREPVYSPPPPGQYNPPPQGQYGAAPGYPPGQPAYDPPPGYQEPRGPAPRPQYGAVPPPQQDDGLRPPMAVGPGGQPGEGEYTSGLPMDVRPET